MNIIELKNSYEKKEIDKQTFIKEMYKFHQILFDYSTYLNHTNIKSIEISDNRVFMTDKKFDIQMICPPYDLRVLPIETLNFNTYEENELQIVIDLLKDKSVILDVGANLGWYSLALSKTFPCSQIYAFEPLPHIFDYLSSHIEINKAVNIKALNLGLSDEVGQSSFYVVPDNSVNASIMNVADNKYAKKISITLTTLDIFAHEENLRKVDFIKCDVEGAELKVLKGASKIIKHYQPIILCEMVRKWTAPFGYHPNDIISYLKSYGYSCFSINKVKPTQIEYMDEEVNETNFLFLPLAQTEKLKAYNGPA
jgi:FkbM family methyltransferase